MFLVSEKLGTVYFALTCLSQLTNYSADIPYYSLAVFTATLSEISYIKNRKKFKILVQNLKYFRMNFI
jgi:hypothetical protein